jgi:NAD-dependent dihydropyrimidine dehydrogenase PreA subunit
MIVSTTASNKKGGVAMDRVLLVDVDNCTGCKICELVCSMNSQGEYNPAKSYIRVLMNKDLDVNLPVLTGQCFKSSPVCGKCAEFCPTKCLKFTTLKQGALFRKRTKIGTIPAPVLSETLTQA